MAEYFGKGISVGSGFDLGANLPLDNRTIQATISDRDTMPTIQLVEGLLVYVKEDKTLYILKSFSPDGSNRVWEKVATGEVVEIVNNLESDKTNAALSAAQGKAIKTLIESLKNSLSAALDYKGTVDNYELLPKESNKKGDVYNVVAAYGTTPAGTNYAWDGNKWDPLGGQVDLSGYATNESVDSKISIAKQEIKVITDQHDGKITELENNLLKKVDQAEGFGLIADADKTQITTNKESIETINTTLANKQDSLTAGEAISLAVNTIDVKLDPTSNGALSKSTKGLKLDLSGVNGTTVKVGTAITGGVTINAEQTIAQGLQALSNSIESAVAGGITSITGSDGTIIVTGAATAKDLKVDLTKLCSVNSSIKVGADGKLDIFWTEIE